MKTRNWFILALLFLAFMATGCSSSKNQAPTASSDNSDAQYTDTSRIEVDDNVYRITGVVSGAVNSITRQISPGGGSGPTCYGTSGCYGGGSFFGPTTGGKGFVRLKVTSAIPATDTAQVGQVSLLKVTDTKATALLEGDIVTFVCRRQYEAIAAVRQNSDFNKAKDATWELDFCRMASPVINVLK